MHLALSGLETLVAPVGSTTVRATLRALPLTIAVLLRSAGAAAENLRAGRVRPDGPFAPPALELWSAIGRHVPAGESVVFFKPRVLSLLADRPSAALGRAALALEHGYVAIRLRPGGTQLSPDAADSLRAIGRLEEVWRNGDFRLFRTVSEPPAGSD